MERKRKSRRPAGTARRGKVDDRLNLWLPSIRISITAISNSSASYFRPNVWKTVPATDDLRPRNEFTPPPSSMYVFAARKFVFLPPPPPPPPSPPPPPCFSRIHKATVGLPTSVVSLFQRQAGTTIRTMGNNSEYPWAVDKRKSVKRGKKKRGKTREPEKGGRTKGKVRKGGERGEERREWWNESANGTDGKKLIKLHRII